MSSRPQARYYLGIDVGTRSARAALFDSGGAMRGVGVREIELFRPAEDFVEQSGGSVKVRTDKVGVSGKAFSHWLNKGHRLAWQIVKLTQAARAKRNGGKRTRDGLLPWEKLVFQFGIGAIAACLVVLTWAGRCLINWLYRNDVDRCPACGRTTPRD